MRGIVMKKSKKHVWKKVFSMLLALTLIAGLLPHGLTKARADESTTKLTDTVTASQLLGLDSKKPEGFDENDDTNPYGASKGSDGTLSIAWDELVVLTESENKDVHEQKWYTKDKSSSKNNRHNNEVTCD